MDSTENSRELCANIIALFGDEELAGRAIVGLEQNGLLRHKVSVMSSIPYPEGTFGTDMKPSRLPFFSALGGMGGAVIGFGLAAGTALLYPLPTGGKPIVALPTVGVIAYEITMLGIILLTLLGVLYEMRLPKVRKPPYDPRISEGYLGLLVPCESEKMAAEAEDILREFGASDIKRIGVR